MSDGKVSVFLSYAHEDDAERVELRKQLRGVRADNSERLLDLWDDRQIPAGGLWDDEIKVALATADIVIFLISSDFIDSDYIENTEMRAALEQRERDETEVIPILLKHCPWKGTGLERFNVIPPDERWVVGDWTSLAEPLNLVAEEVKQVALGVLKKRDRAEERRERYREKVAEMLSDGVISDGEQDTLDELQAELHLPDDVAAQIRGSPTVSVGE